MSDVRLGIQSTPNPNALKFVVSVPVKNEGNVTYKRVEDCGDNKLAKSIFEVSNFITEVYFFDNYITVTQNGGIDWEELESKIKDAILANVDAHNPDFHYEEPKKELYNAAIIETPEIKQINSILDQTVRPALQMDGGDLQIVGYDNKVLRIHYQGACGSCPSSTMGTVNAIQNILRDNFDPEITVEVADGVF